MIKYLYTINWQKFLLAVLIISGLTYSFAAAAANWLPIVPCGRNSANCSPDDTNCQKAADPCKLCHLYQLASNIINFMLYDIAIPGAILLFVVAGYLYMSSRGSQDQVEKAKKTFWNTIIGIFIVFLSWLIIDSILKTIAAEEFQGAWNSFPPC